MNLTRSWRRTSGTVALRSVAIIAATLLLTAISGIRPSLLWLVLLAAGIVAFALLRSPVLAPQVLVASALLLPFELSTGTSVRLNPATILVPLLSALWFVDMARRDAMRLIPSRTTRPLALFLLAGLVSLVVGRATWDVLVPLTDDFLLVQLAQWSIFGFSALAFWLTANIVSSEEWLRKLTKVFLLVAGVLAVVSAIPGGRRVVSAVSTLATFRPPFWILLTGMAGGQLLFNRSTSFRWRVFLIAILVAALVYSFWWQRDSTSNWVSIVATMAVLVWMRFPRIRWPLVIAVVVLATSGVLFTNLYEFAGGDAAWARTGASRLTLIERVVSVTLRNPITGLGPAAYRRYASVTPLIYQRAIWFSPKVSSHNNYVDVFAHTGLLGLAMFLWFLIEVGLLAFRLRRRLDQGFSAGYVNSMLAVLGGITVCMMLADWFLPFVYNIGFPGFQASVLVWLFLGGLVVLEDLERGSLRDPRDGQ